MNAYVAGNLLKIKKRKMMYAYNKDKTHLIILMKSHLKVDKTRTIYITISTSKTIILISVSRKPDCSVTDREAAMRTIPG